MTTREQLRALLTAARAQGEAQGDLEDGMGVLVRVKDERHQLVFRRQGAPIGLVEAISLRVAGDVPDHAAAVNYPPTDAGVHRLSLTWEAEAPARTIFDLPPQPAAHAPAAPPRPAPARGHVWQLLAEGEPLPGSLR
jgi:hypothetical protein